MISKLHYIQMYSTDLCVYMFVGLSTMCMCVQYVQML